jgi:hypothetical protein
MPEIEAAPGGPPGRAQAAELALLVDLEARWENLRAAAPKPAGGVPSTRDLHGRQRTYEAFRARLAAYNQRYTPAHVPELLLNTPARLGRWCQAMRDLLARAEHGPGGHCPAHLPEKAHRWADRIADRVGESRLSRPPAPATVGDVIRDLEALARWCDELARAGAGFRSRTGPGRPVRGLDAHPDGAAVVGPRAHAVVDGDAHVLPSPSSIPAAGFSSHVSS